ncbi:hypothetical protein [Modicisalibacter xianhensis]|uniref:hypothetical protein n=1 Tax=Modicisalibacter xianhensis TaxID=442341 RepID=UPI001062859F|nr:hypothetical protein [Halomonas xianhensis]
MLADPRSGPLLPACGGTEQTFTANGRRWLYCWHPASGSHCYLDVDNDRPIWNRSFHPTFAPDLEFEVEATPPIPWPRVAKVDEMEDFYW